MEILFTICGRAGSKGIKNKNIRNFLEIPLPYYSLAAINLYIENHPENIIDVAVNTDSSELKDLFKINNIDNIIVIDRSEDLATDNAPKITVIHECLIKAQKQNNKNYDVVVDLDITSPLRTVKDIENLICKFKETNCDVAFSVTTARRNPYFNMVKKSEKGYERVIKSSFTTRQEAPEIFDMNASLYAYSPEYLIQFKGVLDGYCEIIQMYDTGVLDLDHENDFELMEVIAKYLFNKFDDFSKIKQVAENLIVG